MTDIHRLACVHPEARLGRNVQVGPFSYVGPDVVLGDDCVLHAHVTLEGPAILGARNVFFPHATLGSAPQDLKYKGGPTRLIVGDDNVFRESVTVHRGTEVDQFSAGVTRIGNQNLFMVGVHIAHDAEIGNHVVMANLVQIAGHCRVEDCANIAGATGFHHFVTAGKYAFIAGMSRVSHDAPPYMKTQGYEQQVRGVNVQGLRRWKFSDESVTKLKRAARLLYARRGEHSPGRTAEALGEIEGDGLIQDPHVAYLVAFVRRKLEVGVYGRVREHHRTDTAADRAGFYASGGAAEARL
jgi:UDP-N-acetylglucosamine acyltransferase